MTIAIVAVLHPAPDPRLPPPGSRAPERGSPEVARGADEGDEQGARQARPLAQQAVPQLPEGDPQERQHRAARAGARCRSSRSTRGGTRTRTAARPMAFEAIVSDQFHHPGGRAHDMDQGMSSRTPSPCSVPASWARRWRALLAAGSPCASGTGRPRRPRPLAEAGASSPPRPRKPGPGRHRADDAHRRRRGARSTAAGARRRRGVGPDVDRRPRRAGAAPRRCGRSRRRARGRAVLGRRQPAEEGKLTVLAIRPGAECATASTAVRRRRGAHVVGGRGGRGPAAQAGRQRLGASWSRASPETLCSPRASRGRRRRSSTRSPAGRSTAATRSSRGRR